VSLHHQVDLVTRQQRGELRADAAVGAVAVAGRERALVEGRDDEIDARGLAPGPELVFEPADLGSVAVAKQTLDLPGELVRVQADDPGIAVREAVH
jgi:hypothetical protein